MKNNHSTLTVNDLRLTGLLSNNKRLTKNTYTQCHALNMAFFVPRIQQACNLLKGCTLDLAMKNEVRISKYGRVKARIKDLAIGNKCNRICAVSNTRPPETKTGGFTKNTYGGQPMPLNTSKRATIRTIQTVHTSSGIIATIHTRYNQKAVIGRLFASFEQLQGFIQSQGLSLELLGGRA